MIDYLNNPWKPARYSVLKSEELENEVYEKGYKIGNAISEHQRNALIDLFNSNHQFDQENGGMFYSVYSRNLEYRKEIHDSIGKILKPFIEAHFKDFKVAINSFVVKVSGPNSEFYLHQDTTGLDESKYSPINLWIPLVGVDQSNGCLNSILL